MTLAREMQTQLAEFQMTKVSVSIYFQTQLQHRTRPACRAGQTHQFQRQDTGGETRTEMAHHAVDGFTFHRRFSLNGHTIRRTGQRFKLKHAHCGQRPHVVGP